MYIYYGQRDNYLRKNEVNKPTFPILRRRLAALAPDQESSDHPPRRKAADRGSAAMNLRKLLGIGEEKLSKPGVCKWMTMGFLQPCS